MNDDNGFSFIFNIPHQLRLRAAKSTYPPSDIFIVNSRLSLVGHVFFLGSPSSFSSLSSSPSRTIARSLPLLDFFRFFNLSAPPASSSVVVISFLSGRFSVERHLSFLSLCHFMVSLSGLGDRHLSAAISDGQPASCPSSNDTVAFLVREAHLTF